MAHIGIDVHKRESQSYILAEVGGFLADGSSLALMTLVEPAEALAALDASGLFTPGRLRTRPLVHIV